MTSPSSFTAASLAQTVLRPRVSANVSCYWCRKILKLCNGERTVAQVAEALHLPLPVCVKLVDRAHRQGWADVQTHTFAGQESLWDTVLEQLGRAREALLHRAAEMNRFAPRAVPVHELDNFLIAVELLLPDREREYLVPALDRVRAQYAI